MPCADRMSWVSMSEGRMTPSREMAIARWTASRVRCWPDWTTSTNSPMSASAKSKRDSSPANVIWWSRT